jgi:hypothetical protein
MQQPDTVKSAIKLLWFLFFLGIFQEILDTLIHEASGKPFRLDLADIYVNCLSYVLDLAFIYLLSIGSKTCRFWFFALFAVSLTFLYDFDFESFIKEKHVLADLLYYPVNAVVIYRLYRPESNDFFNQ